MSYFWASIAFVMAVRIGWTAHGLFVDWKRKRNAKWVTVEIANGAVVKARVEDVNWDKLFGYGYEDFTSSSLTLPSRV